MGMPMAKASGATAMTDTAIRPPSGQGAIQPSDAGPANPSPSAHAVIAMATILSARGRPCRMPWATELPTPEAIRNVAMVTAAAVTGSPITRISHDRTTISTAMYARPRTTKYAAAAVLPGERRISPTASRGNTVSAAPATAMNVAAATTKRYASSIRVNHRSPNASRIASIERVRK